MLPQVFVLVCVCVLQATATLPAIVQTTVPGILVGPLLPPDAPPPLCTRAGVECTGDCKTFMSCGAVDQPGDSITRCPVDRPFCSNNACSAQPDATNPQCFNTPDATNPFTCTAAGSFPDPFNCGLYYVCTAAAPAVPMQWRCPVGSAYDSRLAQCRTTTARSASQSRALEAKMCSTAMCPRGAVGNVAYPPNPALFVFCLDAQRLVFRCRDDRNQVFDAKRGECVFQCVAEGHFVDREDCTRFYTCAKKGGKLVATRNACPVGWAFVVGRCVREGQRACVPEIV